MTWRIRQPLAGLGETRDIRDFFQTALYDAGLKTSRVGALYIVLTQADAVRYLPASRYSLSDNYPGWAVVKSDDALMAVPDTVMRYYPNSYNIDNGGSSAPAPPSGGGVVVPPTPVVISAPTFSDNTLRGIALVGGVMLGAGVVWWLTR